MDTEGTFLGMMGSGGGDDREEAEERRGVNGGGCEGRREGIIGLAGSQKKLARTDTFDPFRVPSPFSPVHDGPTLYNGGSNKSQGLRPNDSDDVPFPVALEMTSAIRFPFTPAQWQELEQQALIFKHIVASVPVPLELLLPIRRSLAASSIVHNTPSHAMSLGGFNVLRCSSSTDPEPGRCRRTDGKKWRCSRDVAPDQRYCERHMHRGRPRSRKPVEVRQQRPNSSINDNPPPSTALARSLSSLAPPLSSFTRENNPPKPTETSEFRVPSQTTMTSSNLTDNSPRYANWMRGETEDDDMVSTGADSLSTSTHRGELLQSKFGGTHELPPRLSTNNAPCYRVHHDNLAFLPDSADLQRNHIQGDGNSVLASDHSNVLESTTVSQPRRFIDAWSIENRWQQHCTGTAKSSASKLSPSHLSLSMSGGAGSAGDEFDQIQMGLGVNDTENIGALTAPSPSWMLPVSWQASSPVGGPLAEVLQSTSGALAADPNPPKSSNSKTGSSRGLNLLTDGWGCENNPRMASSSTGVLQKNLAFLSDSGGGMGSPKLGAKPEMVLQWLNQQEPPKLPS